MPNKHNSPLNTVITLYYYKFIVHDCAVLDGTNVMNNCIAQTNGRLKGNDQMIL